MKIYSISIWQILMHTAVNFGYITLSTFSLFKVWLALGTQAIMVGLNTLIWGCFYAFMIYCIVHTGHFTKKEVCRVHICCFSSSNPVPYKGTDDSKSSSQNLQP